MKEFLLSTEPELILAACLKDGRAFGRSAQLEFLLTNRQIIEMAKRI